MYLSINLYIAEETQNREKREEVLVQRFDELMHNVKNDINPFN